MIHTFRQPWGGALSDAPIPLDQLEVQQGNLRVTLCHREVISRQRAVLLVCTFGGRVDHKQPGWLLFDLVVHCGKRIEGRFIWTLVATDIYTGWGESLPVITRVGGAVLAVIQRLRMQLM